MSPSLEASISAPRTFTLLFPSETSSLLYAPSELTSEIEPSVPARGPIVVVGVLVVPQACPVVELKSAPAAQPGTVVVVVVVVVVPVDEQLRFHAAREIGPK